MSGFDRRQALLGLVAAVAAPEVLAGCVSSGDDNQILTPPGSAVPAGFYTAGELATVRLLADAIIPATDTPGAIDARVPETLDALMQAWAAPQTQTAHRAAIAAVEVRLGQLAGSDVQHLTPAQQIAAVSALDAEAYDRGAPPLALSILSKGPGFTSADQPVGIQYRALKALIAQAYYASEPGAMKELHYENVPGRWLPDAPLAEIGRTWAE